MKIETMDPATGRFTRAVETEGPIRIRWGEGPGDILEFQVGGEHPLLTGVEVKSPDRRIIVVPVVSNVVRIFPIPDTGRIVI